MKWLFAFASRCFTAIQQKNIQPAVIIKIKQTDSATHRFDQVTIGRKAGNDLQYNRSEISGNHAAFLSESGQYFVQDLGSTNGIFVNEVKVSQSEIENRSEFRLGGTRLMLIMTDTSSDLETIE